MIRIHAQKNAAQLCWCRVDTFFKSFQHFPFTQFAPTASWSEFTKVDDWKNNVQVKKAPKDEEKGQGRWAHLKGNTHNPETSQCEEKHFFRVKITQTCSSVKDTVLNVKTANLRV